MRRAVEKIKNFEKRRNRLFSGKKAEAERSYFSGILQNINEFKPPTMSKD